MTLSKFYLVPMRSPAYPYSVLARLSKSEIGASKSAKFPFRDAYFDSFSEDIDDLALNANFIGII